MIRSIATLVLGLLVLAAVYGFLADPPSPSTMIGFLGVMALIVVRSLIWLAAIAAIVIIGVYRKLPGLVVAPLVFFAGWCGTSVWSRYELGKSLDPSLASRSVPTELRKVRTLTLVGYQQEPCCGGATLLVDHVIDRYVLAQVNRKGDVVAIRSTELAAVKDCDAKDLLHSGELQRAGRTDQCLKTTTLDAIPDGVVVRTQFMMPSSGSLGCCNIGTISVRQNGQERVATMWRYGQQTVLSYWPAFGTNSPPTPLWRSASFGPRQLVEIGGPSFNDVDLAAAVYGIDWAAPLKFVEISNTELSRRARELAEANNSNAALDVALQVQSKGYVDDNLIDATSRLINSPYDQQLLKFWQHLDSHDKRKFIEAVIARISDPNAGGGEYSQARLMIFMQREQLTTYMPQAEAIFANRRDLKPWQYEMALRLAMDDPVRFSSEEYRSEQRRRFETLRDDTSDAFARRAIAFKRVYFPPNDEERAFFAEHLDRVPDVLLEHYIRQVGLGHASEFFQRIRERVDAIPDEKLRRDIRGQLNLRSL